MKEVIFSGGSPDPLGIPIGEEADLIEHGLDVGRGLLIPFFRGQALVEQDPGKIVGLGFRGRSKSNQ